MAGCFPKTEIGFLGHEAFRSAGSLTCQRGVEALLTRGRGSSEIRDGEYDIRYTMQFTWGGLHCRPEPAKLLGSIAFEIEVQGKHERRAEQIKLLLQILTAYSASRFWYVDSERFHRIPTACSSCPDQRHADQQGPGAVGRYREATGWNVLHAPQRAYAAVLDAGPIGGIYVNRANNAEAPAFITDAKELTP